MNEGVTHEKTTQRSWSNDIDLFINQNLFGLKSDNRSKASVERNSSGNPGRSFLIIVQMNMWINSLSTFFLATAKLTTPISQTPSLCPEKKKKIKFSHKFNSPVACILISYSTVLVQVDGASILVLFLPSPLGKNILWPIDDRLSTF